MVTKKRAPRESGTPYRLGDPIAVPEFLALPPDGTRYDRDERGRLVLMTMDSSPLHRWPLTILNKRAVACLAPPFTPVQEGGIVFRRVIDLKGRLVRRSFLGPKALGPDLAVLKGQPRYVRWHFSSRGFVLVAEVLSPSTWRNDLGMGPQKGKEQVDRRRTYLESGIEEYWVLNPGVDDPECPVPPRGGWFAVRSADGTRWEPFEPDAGVVRARSVPGLVLDLESYWTECGL